MTYLLSEKAAVDLLEIWDYGNKVWGSDRADQYHSQILSTIDFLAESPLAGTDRKTLRLGYRSFGVGSHIVFYFEEGFHIVVVRVLHKRADFSQHI